MPRIDVGYRPNLINAKYLDDEYDGEGIFTVVGGEEFTTEEDVPRTLECINLREPDPEKTILYSPNATARKVFSEAKLTNTDLLMHHRLVLYTTEVSFGSKEVRGIRIREILRPEKKQLKL